VFFGSLAAKQNDAAGRQQTSFGTIGQCEHRGRGDENYCHYTFSVGDEQYIGVNQAASDLGFGQTAMVYYDRQDPTVNALEDFSEQSRKNTRYVAILLFVLAAIFAFLLWDRAPYGEAADERTL